MQQRSPATSSNLLLRRLPEEDRTAIVACCEPVELKRGDVLNRPNEPIETIVFPESGIVSVVMDTEDDRRVEIRIFGREGMSDGACLMGVDRIPHELLVQLAGTGLRVGVADLQRLSDERLQLRTHLLRRVHVSALQTAQTALANGGYNVEARLARCC